MALEIRRYRNIIAAASFLAVLWLLFHKGEHVDDNGSKMIYPPHMPKAEQTRKSAPVDREYAALLGSGQINHFQRSLVGLLDRTKPSVEKIRMTGRPDPRSIPYAKHKDDADLKRTDFIDITENELEDMRKAHSAFANGTEELALPYVPGRRGIVSTADGDLLPVFLVSLKMLRRTGSKLPVELFLRPQEEDEWLCQELLPSLNARCKYMDPIYLGGSDSKAPLSEYRLKLIALLQSSFEEVLFIDADNFPSRSPDSLFTSEPYISKHLVTWPDYWVGSTSRHLYTIQGVENPPSLKDLPTSETGQLVVSKRTHAQTLLLTFYYNYYGPLHYYQLITQGGHGEGDKDTFLSAAIALKQPFYQVDRPLETLGAPDDSGAFHNNAMLQFDATDDATLASEHARPLFIHLHRGKANANKLFNIDGQSYAGGEYFTFDPKSGRPRRMLGTRKRMHELFGEDLEKNLFEDIRWVTCDIGNLMKDWKAIPSTVMKQGACDKVKAYIEQVFSPNAVENEPLEPATRVIGA